METYQTEGIKLQMLKLSQDTSDSDWERLNANLGRIKSTAESVSSYAWLAPAVVSCTVPNSSAGWKMINSVEDATAKLTQRMDQTVKFLDFVGKMNDGLTMYVEAKQAFQGDKRMGVAFAGLSRTLTFVPVLGGFYGEIVKQIPGLVTHWREFITDYTAGMLRADVYLAMKEMQPAPWQCSIC